MWITKGQWLHIKATKVPEPPSSCFKDFNLSETVSSKLNSGALVPKGSIFEGVLAIVFYYLMISLQCKVTH
jgi:hypothetical protein